MAKPIARRLCALVAWLASGSPALWAGEPTPPSATGTEVIRLGGTPRNLKPQKPLPPQGRGSAVIFIGGMGDEVSGIVASLERIVPPMVAGKEETRAYYYWHAGLVEDDPMASARTIAADIETYRRTTPGADVVLLGHSLGASTALKTASLLPEGQGRVFLLTLDPVDRSTEPVRPAAVTWWGNAYVQESQSSRDVFFALGGRWSHCGQADLNLCFMGGDVDEFGRPYIHDYASSFLMSRGAAKAKPGSGRPGYSLLDALKKKL